MKIEELFKAMGEAMAAKEAVEKDPSPENIARHEKACDDILRLRDSIGAKTPKN